ncbi:MAG TPA: ABC transporter permease [Actinospica sp.]|nr:ABC transporter permease [Actinospica sp.]
MTTATLIRTEGSAVRPTHRPGMSDLMRSEWTKLRTLRSTWWSLGVMIVLSVGFTIAACAVYTHDYAHLDAANQTEFRTDTIGLILQPGVQFASLAISVLGAMLIAGEYSTGMIKATMLAEPRRTRALLAKAGAFAVFVYVASELVAIPSFFIGSAITHAHASVSITDPTTIRALLSFGLFMTAMGLISLAVGTLVRHTAAAISIVLALQFVLPGVLSLIPGSAGEHLSNLTPQATSVIVSSGHNASNVYTPLQGGLILLAWVVVTGGAALVSIKKRDV